MNVEGAAEKSRWSGAEEAEVDGVACKTEENDTPSAVCKEEDLAKVAVNQHPMPDVVKSAALCKEEDLAEVAVDAVCKEEDLAKVAVDQHPIPDVVMSAYPNDIDNPDDIGISALQGESIVRDFICKEEDLAEVTIVQQQMNEKKAAQRERTKRSRVRNGFKRQVDGNFKPVERQIVSSDVGRMKPGMTISRRDLRMTTVMQCSEMKEIVGYGSSGKKGKRFQGAIVRHSANGFDGVEEGLFTVDVRCFAKHGLHEGAKYAIAHRHTEFGNGCALISWEDKPNRLYLTPESCITDCLEVEQTKRQMLGPDRFQPGASDVPQNPVWTKPASLRSAVDYYEYFRSASFQSLDKPYEIYKMILKGNQHWTQQQQENIYRERRFQTKVYLLKNMMQQHVEQNVSYMIKFDDKGNMIKLNDQAVIRVMNKLSKDFSGVGGTLSDAVKKEIEKKMKEYNGEIWFEEKEEEVNEKKMIDGAIDGFFSTKITPAPKRPLRRVGSTPYIPHLKLSLTLDVLRGHLKGTLVRDVDAGQCTAGNYLGLIERKVQAKSIQDRETADKVKRQKHNKLCKLEGCGKPVWYGSRSGHCYEHADPSTKKCTKCQLKARQFAGGLCAGCRAPTPSAGKLEKIYCPSCGCRESPRKNWNCSICVGKGVVRRKGKIWDFKA